MDKWEEWMDIPDFPMKQKLLKIYMDNQVKSTTEDILKATGFTERELNYSNNLVKKYPHTFWKLDLYEFKDDYWYNTTSKTQDQEIKYLQNRIEDLVRENSLLKLRLNGTGMSKSNI